ncbi:MAG: hypothetical protein ABRQ27_13430 [Clostridiaceae bacterium]
MKKFAISFLIFVCLFFNIIGTTPALAAGNILKQGVYKPSDFNFSVSNIFTGVNISSNQLMYLIILDENLFVVEAIWLKPGLEKLDLVPMEPGYRILIIGKGELYFTPK